MGGTNELSVLLTVAVDFWVEFVPPLVWCDSLAATGAGLLLLTVTLALLE